MKLPCVLARALLAVGLTASAARAAEAFPVSIQVDAAKRLGELKPVWRFFGADEPNYATMKDGQKLLADFGALRPGEVYFRAHNLLTSGDGTPALKWGSTDAYTEDAQGRPIYDWKILDGIFDSYLARGVRPYVEIGFMPEALSTAVSGRRSTSSPSTRRARPPTWTATCAWASPTSSVRSTTVSAWWRRFRS